MSYGRARRFSAAGWLAGIACLAALVLWALPPTARAAVPGENGLLTFSAFNFDTRSWSIYKTDDEGGPATALFSPGGGSVMGSGWSPDGSRLLVLSFTAGWPSDPAGPGLFTVNPDGSSPARVQSSPSFGAISPDGTQVAFSRSDGDNASLYVSDLDGTNARRVTQTPLPDEQLGPGTTPAFSDSNPTWSPDGSQIAFARLEYCPNGCAPQVIRRIWVVPTTGGVGQQLTDDRPGVSTAGSPDWSPDGQHILFTRSDMLFGSGASLVVMQPDGTSQTRITPAFTDATGGIWSPDGTKIAFFTPDPMTGRPSLAVRAVGDPDSVERRPTPAGMSISALAWQPVRAQRDTIAPTVACSADDGSWHADNVSVVCTASDDGSGLADANDSQFSLATSVAADSEDSDAATGTHEVCDLAGNCATAGPVTGIKVDRNAPTLSFSQQPNGNGGWFKQAPAATHADAHDNQIRSLECKLDGQAVGGQPSSGPSSLARDVSTSGEGRHSVECTATDLAGNTTSRSDTLRLDLTGPNAPTASTERQPDFGQNWFKDSVTVSFAENGDPDLADGSSGSGVDTASLPAPVTKTQSGSYDIQGSVMDLAGNGSTQTIHTVRVDADPPSVNVSCPQGAVLLNGTGTATVTATDGQSGLRSDPTGNAALDTSSVGTKSITANATDNVGHTASDSCTYQVVYDFTGFNNPLSAPPSVVSDSANKKQAFKFSLSGNQGVGVIAPGFPTQRAINCSSHAPLGSAQPVSVNLTYDAKKDTYSFDWTPGKALAGSCRELAVKFDDGTTHVVWFSFK